MATHREKKNQLSRQWMAKKRSWSARESSSESSDEEILLSESSSDGTDCECLSSDCSSLICDSDTEASSHENFSSDDNDDNDEFNVYELDDDSLRDDLREWALDCDANHTQIDKLLKKLKKYKPDLPSTARTLLHTLRKVPTEIKSGMEYKYFGLLEQLCTNLTRYPIEEIDNLPNNTVDIGLNTDGLQVVKSSKTNMWPILGGIYMTGWTVCVFVIALTCGGTKPKNLDYLTDTVEALNVLLEHGFQFRGRTLYIHIRCIVCDAPAKALIKNTMPYNGYYGCDKCELEGVWNGRVTFTEFVDLLERTDQSFREKRNEEHHKGETPLTKIRGGFDIIRDMPIDYQHQV